MNPDLKAKWIAALRSGNYKQGRFRLKNDDTYCCLGVLCKIAGIPITNDGRDADDKNYEPLDDLGIPTEECFRRNDGAYKQEPMSFAQIADWLEETLDTSPTRPQEGDAP